MPRTKGSKNKAKPAVIDYAAKIEEKQKEKEISLAELADAETTIHELEGQLVAAKDVLKTKKFEIKAIDKELTKLADKKAKADAAAEAEAKKVEVQEMVDKLLANGVSADEILEKLK